MADAQQLILDEDYDPNYEPTEQGYYLPLKAFNIARNSRVCAVSWDELGD